MKELYFHNEDNIDVGEFVASLGDDQVPVLEDLLIVAKYGPEVLNCARPAPDIWEYQRSLGWGRRVVLLFDFVTAADVFIVLHAFRAGPEGTTRSDLRIARNRRRRYPR